MIVNSSKFKEEKEEAVEWETNAIKRAIQHLLKGPLNNELYRKKTVENIYFIVQEEFRKEGVLTESKYVVTANRLLRKIRDSKTVNEAILVLGDYLLA